ncbi:CPCC family cysteine-rich protein (plasmid) [Paenibacillus polymyxa]|uniref:CPCC family cysteine-rich protein n=1 Tax=Paenibacillus polymyxa TaxID=1406 RepID=UPI003B5CA953
MGKYTCLCCGYKTLDDEPPGTYDICEICFWEDDGIQFADPDYDGGANIVSLRQGQQNYKVFGACEEKCIEFVRKASTLLSLWFSGRKFYRWIRSKRNKQKTHR